MGRQASSCVITLGGMPMNTATTEQVLLERCKAGDDAAFTELIKQSSPTARRAVRTIARNPADVDDVMQETFVKAFQALRSFDQRSKFSTWLTRIAINNALMLLRRQKVKKEISLDADGEEREATSFLLADNTLDPEQALIRDQSIQIIREAVHALPRTLREYAERCCIQDMSNQEASSSLRITEGTGKSRHFRARQRLRSSPLRFRCNAMQFFS
jgi:RNA polymerase sigma-70 factor, ECF subfamily